MGVGRLFERHNIGKSLAFRQSFPQSIIVDIVSVQIQFDIVNFGICTDKTYGNDNKHGIQRKPAVKKLFERIAVFLLHRFNF